MALLYGRNTDTSKKLRRTNNRLIVSTDSQTPNENYIVDKNLPTAFYDLFGNQNISLDANGNIVGAEVLIGKGRIVGGFRRDYAVKGKFGPTVLTICNAYTPSPDGVYDGQPAVYPLGVAPFNIYRIADDRQLGNQPNVLVRDAMIEVPLVNTSSDADNVKTGVAYGEFTIGTYVMSDSKGRFVPYNGSGIEQIVGKVFSILTDVPLEGWLQWAVLPENLLADEGIKDDNYPTLVPDAYNPVTEGDNYPRSDNYVNRPFQHSDARGITYLTDGSLFGGVKYTDEACVDKTGAPVTTPAALNIGDTVTFWVQHAPIKSGTIIVKVDTTDITKNCSIDYQTGKIVWTVGTGEDDPAYEGKSVTATYDRGPGVPGITRNWDVAGGLGALHILLGI